MNYQAFNLFLRQIEPCDGVLFSERVGSHIIFTDDNRRQLGYWDKQLDSGFVERKSHSKEIVNA
ncbi:hypothetical protein COB55_05420 [Candidatus Wolfebacteria bacterium]|nr:MAG: hypothetical protein COB55_05420 [Candidatus Wolfebacteria bacterium]